MPKLKLNNVVKRFGENTVCSGVNLVVDQGQMVCLIGASGAGKSTLLRCINLLEPIEDGEIFIDGEDISIPGQKSSGCQGENWNGIPKF